MGTILTAFYSRQTTTERVYALILRLDDPLAFPVDVTPDIFLIGRFNGNGCQAFGETFSVNEFWFDYHLSVRVNKSVAVFLTCLNK